MRLLLLAPPGAGKGTQGMRLADRLGVQHVPAGDLLRAEARAGTAVGREVAAYQQRGDLVPDAIVFDVLTPMAVDAEQPPDAVTTEILSRLSDRSPTRGNT
jgi:adenylate kinase